MRLVDANTIKSKAVCYNNIPQPMVIYHSTEEFEANEKDTLKADCFDALLMILRKLEVPLKYGVTTHILDNYVPIYPYNLWLKTVDKFIPDSANWGGDITYVKGDNDQSIPTDACWVKLQYVLPTPIKLILYTSSGVNSVGITKWDVTAAVRSQFVIEKDLRKVNDPARYEAMVNRYLNRTRSDLKMYKFTTAFLMPSSPTFLDLDASAKNTFGSYIKTKDRHRILISPSFRSSIMQMLKIFVPELKQQVKTDFPPEKMIEMLSTAYGIAKDTKKVSDILAVFKELREIGYEETTAINDQRQLPAIPLVDESKTGKPTEIATLPANEELGKEVSEETFNKIREDLDYPEGFISNFDELSEEDEKVEKEV